MFYYQTILGIGGQPAGGMLSIKPDWDERVADDDTSGYVSMKPNSDGQTVASGDTEGHTTENVLTQMLKVLFFYVFLYTCVHTCIPVHVCEFVNRSSTS